MKAEIASPIPRLERLRSVLSRTGLSRATVYRMIAAGSFIRPVRISERSIAFLSSEVDAWIAARTADRDGAAAK